MAFDLGKVAAALLTLLVGCHTGAAWSKGSRPEAHIEATIPRFGMGMGAGFGSIWIMGTDSLARIRISDNAVTDMPIPAALGRWIFGDTIAGEGAVWIPDAAHGVIFKIDPVSNRIAAQIKADLAGRAESLGVGDGSIWAVCGEGDVLKRFSSKDGTEQATIRLPSSGFGVLVADGSVWVTSPANDELFRIDPASDRVVSTTELNAEPRFMAADAKSIWVFDEGDGTLQRVDGVSGRVIASIATGAPDKGTITAGGGFVWVSTRHVPIIQVDPRTNAIRSRYYLPVEEYATIRYAGGSLWLSGSSVRRIRPPE